MVVRSLIQKNGKNHARDVKETTETIGEEVNRMKYNKDYFTGMGHLANAILYDLNRLAEYYKEKEEKARTCDGQEYYRFIKLGVEEAIDTVKQVLHMQDVVEKVLYTQLEAEGEE